MKNKITLSVAVALLASPIGTQAQTYSPPANEIVIGLLDESGNGRTINEPGVKIEYRSFTPEGANVYVTPDRKASHGDAVISSAIQEIRKLDKTTPIRIVSANVFYDENGLRKLDEKGSLEALDWIKSKGARVVSMAFVGSDTPGMRDIVARATQNNIIVVAGTPNAAGGSMKYPAAYPEVISVTGIAPNLPITRGAMQWGKIAINGEVEFNVEGKKFRDFGSSMATGKIAGVVGYKAFLNPGLTQNQALEFLFSASKLERVARPEFEVKEKSRVYSQKMAMAYIGTTNGVR